MCVVYFIMLKYERVGAVTRHYIMRVKVDCMEAFAVLFLPCCQFVSSSSGSSAFTQNNFSKYSADEITEINEIRQDIIVPLCVYSIDCYNIHYIYVSLITLTHNYTNTLHSYTLPTYHVYNTGGKSHVCQPRKRTTVCHVSVYLQMFK